MNPYDKPPGWYCSFCGQLKPAADHLFSIKMADGYMATGWDGKWKRICGGCVKRLHDEKRKFKIHRSDTAELKKLNLRSSAQSAGNP